MTFIYTLCLVFLVGSEAGADQSLTMNLGTRGQIDLQINEVGAIIGSARPDMQKFVNRLVRPLREPVEIILGRNIDGLDGKILGYLRATELFEVDGSVYAVVRESQGSSSSPSYLAKLDINKLDIKMNDSVGLGFSALTVASLIPMGYAIVHKFNTIDPLAMAASITATLAVAFWFAKDFLDELRRPSGWARLMQSSSNFVRVESLVYQDDRLVDVLLTPPKSENKTEPKSLRSILKPGCGRELTF